MTSLFHLLKTEETYVEVSREFFYWIQELWRAIITILIEISANRYASRKKRVSLPLSTSIYLQCYWYWSCRLFKTPESSSGSCQILQGLIYVIWNLWNIFKYAVETEGKICTNTKNSERGYPIPLFRFLSNLCCTDLCSHLAYKRWSSVHTKMVVFVHFCYCWNHPVLAHI